jgi:hypothetical protein
LGDVLVVLARFFATAVVTLRCNRLSDIFTCLDQESQPEARTHPEKRRQRRHAQKSGRRGPSFGDGHSTTSRGLIGAHEVSPHPGAKAHEPPGCPVSAGRLTRLSSAKSRQFSVLAMVREVARCNFMSLRTCARRRQRWLPTSYE